MYPPMAPEVRPLTPELLAAELVDRIDRTAEDLPWTRVALDGASAADPGALADALVEPLRVRGREVLRISAADFLRPASVRLEYGRHDAEAYYDRWLDTGALFREVFDPTEADGSGLVLPSLWDAARDRATRAERVPLARGGVCC